MELGRWSCWYCQFYTPLYFITLLTSDQLILKTHVIVPLSVVCSKLDLRLLWSSNLAIVVASEHDVASTVTWAAVLSGWGDVADSAESISEYFFRIGFLLAAYFQPVLFDGYAWRQIVQSNMVINRTVPLPAATEVSYSVKRIWPICSNLCIPEWQPERAKYWTRRWNNFIGKVFWKHEILREIIGTVIDS